MYQHWSHIIEPICKQLTPKNIVEIGTREGAITQALLSYCTEYNANLHTIDPNGRIEKRLPRHHVYTDLSLNVLESISSMDLVCIYGEHWDTVYHELLLLHKNCQSDEHFPFIFIHGVQTGIEDFVTNSPLHIIYQKVPRFNDLGILMTENHSHILSSFLADINLSPMTHTYTETLEDERDSSSVLSKQNASDLQQLRIMHSHIQDSYRELRERYGQLSSDLTASQQETDRYQRIFSALGAEPESLTESLGILRVEQSALRQSITNLSAENAQLQASLAEANRQINHLMQTVSWRYTRILRYMGYFLKKILT